MLCCARVRISFKSKTVAGPEPHQSSCGFGLVLVTSCTKRICVNKNWCVEKRLSVSILCIVCMGLERSFDSSLRFPGILTVISLRRSRKCHWKALRVEHLADLGWLQEFVGIVLPCFLPCLALWILMDPNWRCVLHVIIYLCK